MTNMSDEKINDCFLQLNANLEEMIKGYRQLLEVVRTEKQLLISVDTEGLDRNNEAKESVLYRLKGIETIRIRNASALARAMSLSPDSPKLLDLAQHIQSAEQAAKLRSAHSTLQLLITRITEINKENETYAQSALKAVNGSINSMKETFAGKKTYKREGGMKESSSVSGNLVSKEA